MTETADQVNDRAAPEMRSEGDTASTQKYDMDLILDIPLDVSVELGRTKMLVNELLQLGQGSIIELTKPVGEPLDIYINNKLIAKGEVVVMDDKFGIRVADIINPVDRVKFLG
jgi:flagellar motor switch protein FliN/FliY